MGKVVYLIGAGASYGIRDEKNPILSYELTEPKEHGLISKSRYNCANILEGLPIVEELPDRMRFILSKLYDAMFRISVENEIRNNLCHLAEDIRWLMESSAHHSTVDTFAKKLYLIRAVKRNVQV